MYFATWQLTVVTTSTRDIPRDCQRRGFRGGLVACGQRLPGAVSTLDRLAGKGVQARVGTVSLSQALTSQGLPSEVVTPQALGDTATDLVFYPVQPCRVLDTRLSTAGAIGYNGTRNFYVNTNLANQGGNAAGCGMPTDPVAVALNITSTNQDRIGHLRLYPYSTTPPNASILNFQAGTNVVNAAIVQNCYLCGYDFTVESDWAASDVIVDVLGYFRSPTYTSLQQTVELSTGTTISTGSWATVDSPACPTGYVLTGGGVNWTGATINVWIWQSGPRDDGSAYRARVNNQSGSTITVYTSGICARVPGR